MSRLSLPHVPLFHTLLCLPKSRQGLSGGLLWLVLLGLLAFSPQAQAQDGGILQSDRLGITFISSADHLADETRYRQALLLGAGWNRWPLYWQWVQSGPGQFDWSRYDRLVQSDRAHNLKINAILLGIPEFARNGASIRDLGAPVFSDGTDTPGPGKQINPGNLWASFVAAAVGRYQGHVAVWEMWNEPDLEMFWGGGVADYARLLKVGYLAAHHADPNAEVMFAGLAYINPLDNDWLARTLALFAQDPGRIAGNWYFDKVAVHNYSNAWRSGWVIRHAQTVLERYGLQRPIWLNESGVPVWDDYPGPTWAAASGSDRRWRGTTQQQAAFVVQSTAYAWASGAEVVFYHQLYDDCGNQAGGTDFAPNQAGMAGDAHGLYRNLNNAVCFSQSPQPGTPRPAAAAFHTLAQVFASAPFQNGTVLDLNEQATVIAFDRPATSERIYVLWNDSGQRLNLDVPASGTGAELYSITNQDFYIEPQEGRYTIGLPPARVEPAGIENLAIGGAPYLLVETLPGGLQPLNPALVELQPFSDDYGPAAASGVTSGVGLPPGERVIPTPGSILGGSLAPNATPAPTATPLARPTSDPATDTTAPLPFVIALPIISPPSFRVDWGASDDGQVVAYVVWVREAGGEWQPWLQETTDTTGTFTGESGKTYQFAVWARDAAGNWSLNTELTPQAQTAVQ
jgi:hypothetical protein